MTVIASRSFALFIISVILSGTVLRVSVAQAHRHRHSISHAKPAPKHLRLKHPAPAPPLSHQIVIADQLVMVIDTAAPGKTPEQRVDMINERLINIIETEPLVPSRMRLAHVHGQMVIVVGQHMLTEITHADAQANQTTVPVLAHFWLANLKRILPQARPAGRLR